MTMALEELRDLVAHWNVHSPERPAIECIDAAIRELDELLVLMAEAEAGDAQVQLDIENANRRAEKAEAERDALRSKWNVLMRGSTQHLARAERAEAELAALRKRIGADVYTAEVRSYDNYDAIELTHADRAHQFPEVTDKRVRLLVEGDDV